MAGGFALGAIVGLTIPAIAEGGHGLLVDQVVTNSGNVTIGAARIRVRGGITGTAASASIGATGAAASVAANSIITTGHVGGSIAFKDIRQYTENSGAVTSVDNSIRTGTLSGKGSSVNISAAGAVSSVSESAINSPVNATFSRNGRITQTAHNSGHITLGGTISVGRLSGAGVSVGISAVGATSAISFSGLR